MGNCYGTTAKVRNEPYYTREDEVYFANIGLTFSDLDKFAIVFGRFDITGEGSLDLVEFLIDMHLSFNEMTWKVFNMMGGHGDNSICFREVSFTRLKVLMT